MNNNRQVISVSKNIIYPINQLQEYSFKKGNPQLTFVIQGTPNQVLDVASLRLNYFLRVSDDSDKCPNNPSAKDNTTVPLTGDIKRCNIDERVGTASLIQSMTITQDGRILEQIRDYPRLLASLFPNTLSFEDYAGFTQSKYGSFGAKKVPQGRAVNSNIAQSQKLFAGLFSGKPIPFSMLGNNNELRIKINLSPDSFFLYGEEASEFSAKMVEDVGTDVAEGVGESVSEAVGLGVGEAVASAIPIVGWIADAFMVGSSIAEAVSGIAKGIRATKDKVAQSEALGQTPASFYNKSLAGHMALPTQDSAQNMVSHFSTF